MRLPFLEIYSLSARIFIIFIFLIATSLFFSCTNKKKSPNLNKFGKDVTSILLDPEKEVDMDYSLHASKLIDTLNYYPLESPSNIIIGKIDRMIYKDGFVYIFDRLSNAIFIFTDKGKFIGNIEKQGKGNGEYANIDLFSIDNKKQISIISFFNRKIFTYDQQGNFITSRPVELLATDMRITADSSIMFYNSKFSNESIFKSTLPVQDRLFTINGSKELVNGDLTFKYAEALLNYPLSNRNFFDFKDSLSLMEPLTNVIYRIDQKSGKAKPRYVFNFKKGNGVLSYEMENKEIEGAMKEYSKTRKNHPINLFAVYETTNTVAFEFAYSGYMMKSFYSKKTGKVISVGPIWINDMDHISMPNLSAVNNKGHFLGIIEAQSFRKMVSSNKNALPERIKKLYANLKDTDNPVLAEFSMKDF